MVACPGALKSGKATGRTPEGIYYICLVKPVGKYGRSLGLSYPNAADAQKALRAHSIGQAVFAAVANAHAAGTRPPWGTPMGGEIYIHEGGAQEDWTQGCIALNPSDMDRLYPYHSAITQVEIQP